LELSPLEIGKVPMTILSRSVRVVFFDVRGFVHGDVVRDDKDSILRQNYILLDVVRPLSMSENFRRFRMLDNVTARSSMSDDDRDGRAITAFDATRK